MTPTNKSQQVTTNLLLKKRFYKKPLILFFIINTIYLITYYLVFNKNSNLNNQNYKNWHVSIDDKSLLPQLSTTNVNYTEELEYLLYNFKSPEHTTTLDKSILEVSNLLNSKSIYQDDRLTFSIILNYLSNNLNSTTIPFDWSDWVNLSYLNHQIHKPLAARIKCQDLIPHINFRRNRIKSEAEKDYLLFGCINTDELTDEQLMEMGHTRDEMIGFTQLKHTSFTTTEYIRNLQGKTYLMNSQPLPYKVIFLNDKGNDLVLDVEKGKIKDLLNNYTDTEFDTVEQFNKVITIDDEFFYNPQPIINISEESFTYNRKILAEKLKELTRIKPENLTLHQKSFLNSIKQTLKVKPPTNPETRYFKESTLRLNNDNHDSGWHYDWRFFNGKLNDPKRSSIILERLLRNWFKFSFKYEIISWISHGPLLSWYWNGGIFPFDNDLDIQMPIMNLMKLGEFFNQTLVVEDLNEGMGKYLIEVGTFVHNRDISKRGNHIDARFIDIDTGIYIDITGISTSNAKPPISSYQNVNDDIDEGPLLNKNEQTFNDRRVHFYHLNHLSPLKLSMLNGVPCYIPNSIIKRSKYEYPDGALTKIEYNDWWFVKNLQSWIHKDTLLPILDANNYLESTYDENNNKINKLKFENLINSITDEEIYNLLSQNQEILISYYLSQFNSNFHINEIKYLFKIDSTKNKNINDLPGGKILDDPQNTYNENYLNLILNNVHLNKPIRESIFEFEKINGGNGEFYGRAFAKLDEIEIT
ncbi:uncharacterized protein KGF55_001290 [Candida pseudojiufengensis]|uniref:uncharacterized protein n=1 Tax=Candida pseudojiufengensis TaxID=497109 RepID=UPI002224876F|nr:uncharacterized protein KGF55_001290 [Candida pseudojiufengensis]KAI5965926.1 hypothetical protein KGF55_001290 [Candida pseudojiufengensis]